MYEIDSKLLELEAKGTPIRVSLIGCGPDGEGYCGTDQQNEGD